VGDRRPRLLPAIIWDLYSFNNEVGDVNSFSFGFVIMMVAFFMAIVDFYS